MAEGLVTESRNEQESCENVGKDLVVTSHSKTKGGPIKDLKNKFQPCITGSELKKVLDKDNDHGSVAKTVFSTDTDITSTSPSNQEVERLLKEPLPSSSWSASADSGPHDKYRLGKTTWVTQDCAKEFFRMENLKDYQGNVGVVMDKNLKVSEAGLYEADAQYKREMKIGQGGFGTVYRCTDKISKKQFVEKEVKKKGMNYQEVEVLLEVKHENIVKCLGVLQFVDRGHIKIQILLEDGGCSLSDFLRNEKKDINWQDGAYQIARALEYLQLYGIIHGDVKPGNIVVQQLLGTNCFVWKLADFGAAKLSINQFLCNSCTWEYMAPECLKTRLYISKHGIKDVEKDCPKRTFKVDSWSLGCVICWLVTGKTVASELLKREKHIKTVEQKNRHLIAELLTSRPNLVHDYIQNIPDFPENVRVIVLALTKNDAENRWSAKTARIKLEQILRPVKATRVQHQTADERTISDTTAQIPDLDTLLESSTDTVCSMDVD